ncbi:MAG: hypothetical protein IKY96_01350 [Oscillospiraceae bacterium]|nr:hypothetical protein [Oscillospiraceae bacterium]
MRNTKKNGFGWIAIVFGLLIMTGCGAADALPEENEYAATEQTQRGDAVQQKTEDGAPEWEDDETSDREKTERSLKDAEFLMAGEWYYHDHWSCGEIITLGENGEFYWGCFCGEPMILENDVQTWDFEFVEYDKDTSTITLFDLFNGQPWEMKVLDYSDFHLILAYDDKVKCYTNGEYADVAECAEEYLEGSSGALSVLGINKKEAVLGPHDYYENAKYSDDAGKKYQLDRNVELYAVSASVRISKEGAVTDSAVDYKEISVQEASEHIKNRELGYIWIDRDLEIERITFYEELKIEE